MLADTKKLLKGSYKAAIGTLCGVILANAIDSQTPVYQLIWWKHVLIVSGTLLVITEARYWKKWSENGNGNNGANNNAKNP